VDQRAIESILWDCVNDPTEDDAHFGYQSSGISKLAELLAAQSRKISELETKVAELSAASTNKQKEKP
jgi:hypothetical protein